MRTAKGFSLIELLIVVAIILVIAAIAVPGFIRSRIVADESSAAADLRVLNEAQVSYSTAYPAIGYAGTLSSLAGTCTGTVAASSTSACLIDSALGAGIRGGYNFNLTNVVGTPASNYNFIATPVSVNFTGVHNFCTFSDAVLRSSTSPITTCDGTISAQQ